MTNKPNKIIEEFREKFCVEPCEDDKGKYLGRDFVSEVHAKQIEQFLLQALKSQEQQLTKEISWAYGRLLRKERADIIKKIEKIPVNYYEGTYLKGGLKDRALIRKDKILTLLNKYDK